MCPVSTTYRFGVSTMARFLHVILLCATCAATDSSRSSSQNSTERFGSGTRANAARAAPAVPLPHDERKCGGERERGRGPSWEAAAVYKVAPSITLSADVMEPTVRHSTVPAVKVTTVGGGSAADALAEPAVASDGCPTT